MLKLIRNHQKKFLAIFLVMLMVVFLINRGPGGGNGEDRLIGHLGDKPVYSSEEGQAEQEWKILRNMRNFTEDGQVQPIAQIDLGQPLFEAIDDKPVLFFLLQKEAENQGVVVDPRMVAERGGQDQGPDGDAKRQAARGLLLVIGLRNQLADIIKPTEPALTQYEAAVRQKAKLSLVTYHADQFRPEIGKPTADQLRKMYDRLSHVVPVSPDSAATNQNPLPSGDELGFGYELPRRVKLQYIDIPRASVLQAIAKTPPPASLLPAGPSGNLDYDWEVAAKTYYYAHIAEYPSTQTNGTNPATLPTTQPYAEVQQKILDQLRAPDADALENNVRNAVFDKLHQDWDQYAPTTQSASRPATAPSTQAVQTAPKNSPYATVGYLQKLALDIQKRFGVLPVVHEVTDWQTAQNLALEPEIGSATANEIPFAQFAVGSDDPAEAGKNLDLLEPSSWLSDTKNNSFIFRLTGIAPAVPSPFENVQSTVAADWVTQQAYDKAVAAAKELADKAKGKELRVTAAAAGMPAFFTDFFQPRRDRISKDLVDPKAEPRVNAEAARLMGLATASDPHPISVVELPMLSDEKGDKKPAAIVVQLAGTASALPPGMMWRARLYDFAQDRSEIAGVLASQYFSYDAVTRRLGYKPVKEEGT